MLWTSKQNQEVAVETLNAQEAAAFLNTNKLSKVRV